MLELGKHQKQLGVRCTTNNPILTGRTMTSENVMVQVDGRSLSAGNPDWAEVEFGQFQTISDRANRLLSQKGNFDVDFKTSISGLVSDDLVSFANSATGGAILIGVSRTRHGNGGQKTALIGCAVGDRERLEILAKANQCVPPVSVSIFVENCAEKPFYRIEIPSGSHKPYCTSGGTYKIRGDGRNEMLYPAQLLALFLEAEGVELVRWFQQATTSFGSAARESKPRATARQGHCNQFVWDIQGSIADSLGAPTADGSFAESDAARTGAFPGGAPESYVRLSSQDLCGFLMRLP